MIYRLSSGSQSEWRKRLSGMGLILIVTIGLPALAAWINYDHYTGQPDVIAQSDSEGSVLGDSIQATTPTNPDPAAAPMTVTPAPVQHRMHVGDSKPRPVTKQQTMTVTPAAPAPPAATAPAPVVVPEVTEETEGNTVPETDAGLEVELPPIIDLEVDLLPGDLL